MGNRLFERVSLFHAGAHDDKRCPHAVILLRVNTLFVAGRKHADEHLRVFRHLLLPLVSGSRFKHDIAHTVCREFVICGRVFPLCRVHQRARAVVIREFRQRRNHFVAQFLIRGTRSARPIAAQSFRIHIHMRHLHVHHLRLFPINRRFARFFVNSE